MSDFKMKVLWLVCCFAFAAAKTTISADEKAKQLSLFAVVKFKNLECTSTSGTYKGLKGTCFSSTECSTKSGSNGGNCASGFGQCCVFIVTATSATISNNCTHVQNAAYPTTISSTASSYAYTISPENPTGICNIRLDFTDVNIADTDGADIASTSARIQITGPTKSNPPLLNGYLTGQHVYVETGRSSTTTSVAVVTLAANTGASKWRMKASFIECDSIVRPPTDCHQYFTTDSGIVGSYNSFNPTSADNWMLADQQTASCIRQNEQMCTVAYRALTFHLDTTTTAQAAAGCATATLTIPGVTTPLKTIFSTFSTIAVTLQPVSQLCGQVFSTVIANAATNAGNNVITSRPPFIMQFLSDPTAAADGLLGYKLQYNQQGCGHYSGPQ